MPLLSHFFSVFSIRLGSIIVAVVHLVEGLALGISSTIISESYSEEFSSQIIEWTTEKDMLFLTGILRNITESPVEYLHTCSGLSFFYSFTCVLLIRGALSLNIWLVIPFVIMELARLFLLTGLVVSVMLLVKKNSLNLGLLMGGSIGGGFFLLFLYYLWSCPFSLCQALTSLRQEAKKPVMNGNGSKIENGLKAENGLKMENGLKLENGHKIENGLKNENGHKLDNDKHSIQITDVNLSKPTTSPVLWNPAMWGSDPYTNGAVYIE